MSERSRLDAPASRRHDGRAPMSSDDLEDCPTFTRRPPASPDADDDGPPTDVDDGPPTFSLEAPRLPTRVGVGDDDAPLPSSHVTLVNAAPPHQRLSARVVTADATHLFVVVDGEPAARRISRVACFEHPVGGGWSTWRLSGADRERWRVAGQLPSRRPPKSDDASA
jgi:hypothetical protein